MAIGGIKKLLLEQTLHSRSPIGVLMERGKGGSMLFFLSRCCFPFSLLLLIIHEMNQEDRNGKQTIIILKRLLR